MDFVRLRDFDPPPKLSHRVVVGSHREEFGHLNRLLVMSDHALHELDVCGSSSDRTKIDGLFCSDFVGWFARGARLDDRRIEA
jgi:hypothetical protein